MQKLVFLTLLLSCVLYIDPGEAQQADPVILDVNANTHSSAADDRLNGMLWMQTSLEYSVLCQQTYLAAREPLRRALCNRNHSAAIEQTAPYWHKPPAIILDVDETVLDNSPVQANWVASGKDYNPTDWNAWCNQASAKPLAGAVEFITFARCLGIHVFFVTNRNGELDQATAKNLTTVLGYSVTPDMVMCKNEQPEWTSDKSTRRAAIAANYRILMLFGDQFNDFTFIEDAPPAKRVELGRQFTNRIGSQWILLPNPVYGDWEQSAYGHDFSLPKAERERRKHATLKPATL